MVPDLPDSKLLNKYIDDTRQMQDTRLNVNNGELLVFWKNGWQSPLSLHRMVLIETMSRNII